ncbi:MAG: DEAD/DEAH box helicase family protein [Chthoniobacterales bacterium]|nr:DEAD/DEAH box helicase family protein [Chthoniobacterales bacterium]
MELREHQKDAVAALLAHARGIIRVPAGGGKTIIAAAAVAELPAGQRLLWIANTTEQCEQAREALALTWARNRCSTVTVRCAAGGWSGEVADVLVVDECHHGPAEQWESIIRNCGATIRWGMTATPYRKDDLAGRVFSLLGPIIYDIDRIALESAGHLTRARVTFHGINDKDEMARQIERVAQAEWESRMRRWPRLDPVEQRKRCLWQAAQQIGIVDNARRNRYAQALARELVQAGRSLLMLIGSVEHGAALAEGIPGAAVVYSKLGAKVRRQRIEAARSGDLRCLIATSLADEGLDIPRADTLILVHGGRSAAKLEQRTGRVLRAFEGKEHGEIHDFTDVQHGMLAAQARSRSYVYKKLGYEVIWPK